MSIAGIQWAYGVEGLSAPARAVLVALGWMADERDECWPSQSTLARMTSLTDRTVRTALAALEADGLITRTPRHRDFGRGRTSDLYTVCRDARPTGQIGRPYRKNRSTNRKEIPAPPEGASGPPRKELPGMKEQKEQTVKEEHSPSPSALGHTLAELEAERTT